MTVLVFKEVPRDQLGKLAGAAQETAEGIFSVITCWRVRRSGGWYFLKVEVESFPP